MFTPFTEPHVHHIMSSGFAMAPPIRSSEAPYKVK